MNIIKILKDKMMKNRRDFLKSTAAAGLLAATAIPALAKEGGVKNIFAYSAENPRRWDGKAGSHAPVVTVEDGKVSVETKHGMAPKHYIVKHAIVTPEGEVLGEQVFFPEDKKALSTYEIKGKYPKLYALSFCNLHDLWVSEFSI
jgi:superoxide reductase